MTSPMPLYGADSNFPDVLDTDYRCTAETIECIHCGRTWHFPKGHVITIGEQVQLLSHAHDHASEGCL